MVTEESSSMYEVLSGAIDACIGVKDKPRRLVAYSYGILGALLACICVVWSVIPRSAPELPVGVVRPRISQLQFALDSDAFLWNGFVLRHNLWALEAMVGAFVLSLAALALLITRIGFALEQEAQERKSA